jgi:hypothetical protein
VRRDGGEAMVEVRNVGDTRGVGMKSKKSLEEGYLYPMVSRGRKHSSCSYTTRSKEDTLLVRRSETPIFRPLDDLQSFCDET